MAVLVLTVVVIVVQLLLQPQVLIILQVMAIVMLVVISMVIPVPEVVEQELFSDSSTCVGVSFGGCTIFWSLYVLWFVYGSL